MGSSILSEGCKHLDSQDGALQCYYYPLNRLPASRLLLPRSGLERSGFVPWPEAALPEGLRMSALAPQLGGKQTSGEQAENDVVDDSRSRHRMCQKGIVEQRITGGGHPYAG